MTCLLCHSDITATFSFIDLFLFKRECSYICSTCLSGFEELGPSLCSSCSKPSETMTCSDCNQWKRKGIHVNHSSLFRYNEAMKDYFQTYKFQGDYILRRVFAPAIKKALKTYEGYVIVPVPVSDDTYAERGFNQVEGLLEAAGVPYQQLLIKQEAIKQSLLSRQERLMMKNHYQIKADVVLPDKILLVDDVYTTGATLLSIQQLVIENGVKEVKTFSLAR